LEGGTDIYASIMLKTVIVEDEIHVRQDLQLNIAWDANGFELCGTFSNGKSALEYICKNPVDVVITDIKMPMMSGLELAGCIRKVNKNIIIVFLTAYEEFDYARRALHLDVDSYWLKHELTPSFLETNLRRIKSKTNQDDKFFGDFKKLPRLADNQNYYYLHCIIDNMPNIATNKYKSMMRYELLDIIEAFLISREVKCFNLKHAQEDELQFVIIGPARSDTMLIRKYLYGLLNDISLWIFNTLNISVSIYADCLGTSISGLSKKIQSSNDFRNYKYFNGTGVLCITDCSLQRTCIGISFADGQELFSVLFDEKGNLNNTCFMKAVNGFLFQIVHESSKSTVIFHAKHFINSVDSALKICNLSPPTTVFNAYDLNYVIDSSDNVFDLKKHIYMHMDELLQWLFLHLGRNNSHGYRALLFIHKHYCENITLDTIAEHVGVSKEYICTLFKKTFKKNISNYLLELRMQKAASLLSQGFMVYETADMVGFKTVQYFSSQFKRVMDIGPKEFRDRFRIV